MLFEWGATTVNESNVVNCCCDDRDGKGMGKRMAMVDAAARLVFVAPGLMH